MVSPFMPEPQKVAAIRDLLPATGAGIYLDAGTAGPLPAETQRAMDEQSRRELATGRAGPDRDDETRERLDEARAAVAAVLVADPDEVELTHSTTDGLARAMGALRWSPTDRVLRTNLEHPAAIGVMGAVRDRAGVELETIDLGDATDDDATVGAFERALERPARALVVSHVSWATGVVLPVARIAALAREAGAAVIVDGAQAPGAIPVAIEELGADAYALSGYKWLLGPEGMGAVWLRPGFADTVASTTGLHRPSLVGLARSCGWLSMYLGLPWVLERAARLAAETARRLAAIPGVTLLAPWTAAGDGLPGSSRPAGTATMVAFRIAGWPAGAALDELGSRAFAILRDLPELDAIRASIGCWNTEDELERFASAVELLAGHAPGTLPPRRTLVVLGSDDRPLG